MGDPVEYEIQEHITKKGGIYYNQGLYYCKPKQLAPKTPKNRFFFLINYFRQCKAGLEGKYSFKIKNENTRTTPTKVFLVSLLLTVNRHIFLWGFE